MWGRRLVILFSAFALLGGCVAVGPNRATAPNRSIGGFAQQLGVFEDACIAQAPTFSGSRDRFRAAGITADLLWGGLNNGSNGMRAGVRSAGDILVCWVSMPTAGQRAERLSVFAHVIARHDANAQVLNPAEFASHVQGLFTTYALEDNVADGVTTLTIRNAYRNF